MTTLFQLPVVHPSDNDKISLVDALSKLNSVLNDVFGTISNRVDSEKARIDSIAARIEVAENKVQNVRKRFNQQVLVASPATFPCDDDFPVHPQPLLIPSKIVTPTKSFVQNVIKNKTDNHFSMKKSSFLEEVISVDSLLVYGSSENPYTKCQARKVSHPKKKKKEHKKKRNHTVFFGDTSFHNEALSLRYRPAFEGIPDLRKKHPSYLKYLPFVARDVIYEEETSKDQFYPSLQSLDLPEISPKLSEDTVNLSPPLPKENAPIANDPLPTIQRPIIVEQPNPIQPRLELPKLADQPNPVQPKIELPKPVEPKSVNVNNNPKNSIPVPPPLPPVNKPAPKEEIVVKTVTSSSGISADELMKVRLRPTKKEEKKENNPMVIHPLLAKRYDDVNGNDKEEDW